MEINNQIRCANPREVQITDMEEYLDGQGRPEYAAHLKNCLFCQKEVSTSVALTNRIRQVSNAVKTRYRKNCVPAEQIQEYVVGWLKGAEKKQVKVHLDSCPYCWLEYKQFLADLAEPLIFMPEPLPLPVLFRKVIARLMSQPLNLTALSLRGDDTNGVLIYTFEDITILLNFEPDLTARNQITLTGTITMNSQRTDQFKDSKAILKKKAEIEIAKTEIDMEGNFFLVCSITNYANLKLEIHLQNLLIETPELPLG
jgi:hypothetical protein